jgi:hypothetical protein
MFFGTGATSSVTQAAGGPAGGVRASPKTLVVLVKTNESMPAAAASSSRLSVLVTLTSTKSWREWVATWGLCSVAAWKTARTPAMHRLTRGRSVIEPMSVV